jgi:hypothetical protein
VQGTGATVMVSFPLRGKDELHCSQRGTRATKASHNFGNIVEGEDGSVINLDNISALETLFEGLEGSMLRTSTMTKDPRDISPMKTRAATISNLKLSRKPKFWICVELVPGHVEVSKPPLWRLLCLNFKNFTSI